MLLSATNTGLDIFLIVWVVVIIATVIGELLANAKGKGPGNPVNP